MVDMSINLARLIRNNPSSHSDGKMGYICDDTIQQIKELYGTIDRTIPDKKGNWIIHERNDFSIPYFSKDKEKPSNGFCAVYGRDHEPRTIFLGNYFQDRSPVYQTAEKISENILGKQKDIPWPLRDLNADNGVDCGLPVLAVGGAGVVGLSLLDMAFTKNGIIPTMLGYNTDREGVMSPLIRKFLEYGDNASAPLAVGGIAVGGFIVGVVAAAVGSILAFEYLGDIADKKRNNTLPEQAYSYKFGNEAEEILSKEHALVKDELKKRELFEKFRKGCVHISKTHFEKIYGLFQGSNKDTLSDVNEYYKRHHFDDPVPLEKIINVFAPAH